MALVYNMLNLSTGPAPQLKDGSGMLADIIQEVQEWASADDQPDQGIYVLDHR